MAERAEGSRFPLGKIERFALLPPVKPASTPGRATLGVLLPLPGADILSRMFRQQPQAFVALPRNGDGSYAKLRAAIEDALARHQVKSVGGERAGMTASSLEALLRGTDLVIADITDRNPNVMVEVGMALGMGKRLLLLSRGRSSDLPVDLLTHQIAVYNDVDSVRTYLDLWLRDVMSGSPA